MAARPALTGASPIRPAIHAKAKHISAKYSAGPNDKAQLASKGANSTMPMVATSEPTKELQAEMDSATPPSPLRAMGYPSSAVMMAPASPGTLSKMDEIRPPYSQPIYTAASRISDVSAGNFMAKARGIRMATPLMGPRPGSRPTMVPIKQPIAAISRLVGLRATPKPATRCCRMSISVASQQGGQWADG